jgi:hypothetical protein
MRERMGEGGGIQTESFFILMVNGLWSPGTMTYMPCLTVCLLRGGERVDRGVREEEKEERGEEI